MNAPRMPHWVRLALNRSVGHRYYPVVVAMIAFTGSTEVARMIAAGLVRLIEQRAHLGVLTEHHPVEMGGERFAAAFQQRHGGFDQVTLSVGQHGVSPQGK